MTRKERLTTELVGAEDKLDALSRSQDHATMRGQQAIAGQRCRVLQLRAELAQIEIDNIRGATEEAIARRNELREDRTSLLMRVKDAELSARAASRQATEDELPELMRRLKDADLMDQELGELH